MPGDPQALREVARAWWQIADDSEYARVRIQQLLDDDVVMQWIGKAATAFRANASKLPGQLEKCATSYRLAADAIWWWSGVLETCQADADRGLAIGRIAREDLNAALLSLASAQDNAASATRYQATLELPPGATTAHTPAPDPHAVTVAVRRAQYSNEVVARAQDSVADAQERLDAAKRLVADAVSLREQQGRVAAKRIHEASDAGIPPDSFWHKVDDVLDEAWHIAVTVAQVVVIVGGIAALIVGGPIAWAVVAAGAVLLTDAVTKYVQGKATLWDVGLAALACIPCTEGLTTFSALSDAFRSGGLAGTAGHLFGAARETVNSLTQGLREGLSQLRTAERNLVESRGLAEEVKSGGALETADQNVSHLDDLRNAAADAKADGLLDEADHAAIEDYTGAGYLKINTYLRQRAAGLVEADADLDARAAAVSRALSKLPNHEGIVYRGGSLSDEMLSHYQVGTAVVHDAFTSASADSPFAGNVQFTIFSRTGKNIAKDSRLTRENEILFDKGATFRVIVHDVERHTGIHVVHLKEAPRGN
jgi:hypothetical protein